MSDLRVWELGPHQCTIPHEIWMAGRLYERCPGGREIVLREHDIKDSECPWAGDSVPNVTVYVLVEEA